MKGFLIAAPSSGSGKTTVTLGLLRALRERGVALAPAKAGPDYIDPAFHAAASGAPCFNLDPWAMRPELIGALAARMTEGDKLLVAEAMMGLFDGAIDGTGSAADLAVQLGLPVILVVDCSRQSQSVAALVSGFRDFRNNVLIAGLVLNRVGSIRHEAMLRAALEPLGIPVLGAVARDEALSLPERHLGLVQAGEHGELDAFIAHAAHVMAERLDLKRIEEIARQAHMGTAAANVPRFPPLGQHIAVARDDAFAFAYTHILDGWRRRGASLSLFSPLADEAPDTQADAIYLPGGYPELHGGRLASAENFREGLHRAAANGTAIYGECGGYMVLGEALEDAVGQRHEMLGLLPLETSFAKRKLHLGYRKLTPLAGSPWNVPLRGHEFHYASIVREGAGERLFQIADALNTDLGEAGLRVGSVAGSFMHVIDIAGDET
ncbi:cobyrinate a,c-diamide synthase [Phyllobacterium leguminum]|uniref:Hydrogenobyrinate a,c-diamide synthase n=1 Tax=Phyllobacterium leguminum TaxID=314237 RepID=A0A318T912_9HYPH|nr:cobyrinate a,c-diamide synthase [Phyllobacterium leguminum]PYE90025.1 hydrogenobyrinic acid a,c-diamide synthase (glutamine-hydrolysing) /cobyrinate a,c-diamide synthase [Phyllobacterium leguminum]